MVGFKHRGSHPQYWHSVPSQSADQSRGEIRQDIAKEILHHHDVELGLDHKLHAGGIDNAVVGLDVRILCCDLAKDFEEQPVTEFQNVGFVNERLARSSAELRA